MSGACPVFGFTITIALRDGVATDVGDAITADFIDLLEANGMSMGGGGDRVMEFVVSRNATQATNADRLLVMDWTRRWLRDADFTVTDLVDLDAID